MNRTFLVVSGNLYVGRFKVGVTYERQVRQRIVS
jgi:hypothetical protein